MKMTPLLSIIVPVFNEAEGLGEFHRRLGAVLDGLPLRAEIVYVDDGSSDGSLECLQALHRGDPKVAVLALSRNFGKEAALTAGLEHAGGEAVVVIDADLQDPPELISAMVAHWRQGYDIVYARRTAREGESILKRFTAYAFYRVIERLCNVRIPRDTGDYRLLSRRAVDSVLRLQEGHRFMKGLFAWIGFRQVGVDYRRDPRHAGRSKWNYWKLWNFALEGITSFTTTPLKVSTYIGLAAAIAAFLYGLYIIIDTLMHGNPVPGYPSLLVVMLFLGGSQLIALGVIGEYLGRMFDETKGRPLYLVSDFAPPRLAGPRAAPRGRLPASRAFEKRRPLLARHEYPREIRREVAP